MLADDASHQEVLDRAAVALPVIISKLHLFANGNGRTSRLLRMLIRDGTAHADTSIDAIVNKDIVNYDASPHPEIDRAISEAIMEERDVPETKLVDDLDSDSDLEPEGDPNFSPSENFANIDPSFINIRMDYLNFNILARDFAKNTTLEYQERMDESEFPIKQYLLRQALMQTKRLSFLNYIVVLEKNE